ncbi:Pon2 [Fonsecaea pedrosoi]|nr:Pon2 [Fonsecaea pedrosoi]
MSGILRVSLLLPLVAVLLYNQSSQLGRLVGRVEIDKTRLVRWENSSALNNHDCQVIKAANACEDVKIHFPSHTAFLSCGDPVERTHWYPCAGVRTVSLRAESSFREQLFKHDLETGQTTELQIKGLEGDFITHGIDIFPLPEEASRIHIFAVNHARSGDSIAIFAHTLGSDEVELVKNVKHPNIKTANGVAATGPLDFFVTNDHYFAGGPLRTMEEAFGPWGWATNVQYCNAEADEILCRQVSGTFTGANGINVWKDRLYVGDSKNGTVTVFEVHGDKSLTYLQTVSAAYLSTHHHHQDLGAAADNINIVPTTGDLIVAVFPTLENLSKYLENVKSLGKEFLVPAAALRLRRESNYTPELIYFDNGATLSFMTAAHVYKDLFVGASVLQFGGFAVCKATSVLDV